MRDLRLLWISILCRLMVIVLEILPYLPPCFLVLKTLSHGLNPVPPFPLGHPCPLASLLVLPTMVLLDPFLLFLCHRRLCSSPSETSVGGSRFPACLQRDARLERRRSKSCMFRLRSWSLTGLDQLWANLDEKKKNSRYYGCNTLDAVVKNAFSFFIYYIKPTPKRQHNGLLTSYITSNIYGTMYMTSYVKCHIHNVLHMPSVDTRKEESFLSDEGPMLES